MFDGIHHGHLPDDAYILGFMEDWPADCSDKHNQTSYSRNAMYSNGEFATLSQIHLGEWVHCYVAIKSVKHITAIEGVEFFQGEFGNHK